MSAVWQDSVALRVFAFDEEKGVIEYPVSTATGPPNEYLPHVARYVATQLRGALTSFIPDLVFCTALSPGAEDEQQTFLTEMIYLLSTLETS